MPLGFVLLVSLLVAVALLAVAASSTLARLSSRSPAAVALIPLVTVVLLAVYVFGEDSYRDDGTSRWDAYRTPGGALGPMFVASVVLMTACAGLLFYAGRRKEHRLLRATAGGGAAIGLLLVTPTIFGFSLN